MHNLILKEFGDFFERQERVFISLVNDSVSKNDGKPISIKAGNIVIDNVISAKKVEGTNELGKEPYADVVIEIKNGKKYNLSLKGESAPSLAGGGLKALEIMMPNLIKTFFFKTHEVLSSKFKKGDKIPNIYAKINHEDVLKILKGNKKMGGPIDYMYIGPMDVVGNFENGMLILNGKFFTIEEFSRSKELYFRLRPRREDQTFDPDAKTKSGGIPKIYGVSPSKGDSAGRLVITDTISLKGLIISL